MYLTYANGVCSGSPQARQAGLPADASCEDLQIEVSLPFLNAFVQQALERGAAPYISQQQRDSMGVMPTSRHHEAAEQPHALRFAAYETAKAPGAVQSHNLLDDSSQGQRSRSHSPVKGELKSSVTGCRPASDDCFHEALAANKTCAMTDILAVFWLLHSCPAALYQVQQLPPMNTVLSKPQQIS